MIPAVPRRKKLYTQATSLILIFGELHSSLSGLEDHQSFWRVNFQSIPFIMQQMGSESSPKQLPTEFHTNLANFLLAVYHQMSHSFLHLNQLQTELSGTLLLLHGHLQNVFLFLLMQLFTFYYEFHFLQNLFPLPLSPLPQSQFWAFSSLCGKVLTVS